MSMLSAQCDELRAMAESVGLAMPQAATLMMGAADAIDRHDAGNARLRELVSHMHECMSNIDADGNYESQRIPLQPEAAALGVGTPGRPRRRAGLRAREKG